MVTIAANVDVSKVKVKEDVSRVLFDQDFGFGHHLCHYQVFFIIYSMISLIYTVNQESVNVTFPGPDEADQRVLGGKSQQWRMR